MNEAYHIYMKQASSQGDYIDIEAYPNFKGLKYSKCTGLNDKGKRKNVYVESYPEDTEARVYMGNTVTREPTDVTLTLLFTGTVAERQLAYKNFCAYVENDKIYFYDNIRNKEVLLILPDPVKVSEEVFKGSEPYTEIPFKFQNIWGESHDRPNV